MVVSLDIAKAFDSVDWNYMSTELKHMEFGVVFRTWISLLYSKPMCLCHKVGHVGLTSGKVPGMPPIASIVCPGNRATSHSTKEIT